jgi:hypothetical protein
MHLRKLLTLVFHDARLTVDTFTSLQLRECVKRDFSLQNLGDLMSHLSRESEMLILSPFEEPVSLKSSSNRR